MRKRWAVKELTDEASILGKELNFNPIVVQLLLNREVAKGDFISFMNPQVSSLHSPLLLPDIKVAVERIKKALKKKEKIFLFGDYDVDGITSLTIFHEYIKNTGGIFSFYIPHRTKEGFGLNKNAVRTIKKEGGNVIIAFDCGTNSFDEIELARSLGIDVIVIDHHQPQDNFKGPLAFVNPKRKDCRYPFPYLSSAAVAFKVVQALKEDDCFDLLDLVALSIVCDVVSLRGENRILLKEGLKRLKNSDRFSINALCKTSGVKKHNLDIFHLGYILGPRINASGRVNTAKEALDMFLAKDAQSAETCARRLEGYNRLRREIESGVLKEADDLLSREGTQNPVSVVYKQGWHHGVLGIVASRLLDKYYRPTLVIGFDQDKGRGSARSVGNFNIVDALNQCGEYLCACGGHKKAAGIEILYKNVEGFKKKLNEVIAKTIDSKDLIPCLDIDLEIGFEAISVDLAEAIENLKPYGEGNPVPLFTTKKVFIRQSPKKVSSRLYSVWLSNGGFTYEAVFGVRGGFGEILNYGKEFEIVYCLEKNYYQNSLKLVLKDIRLA